MFLHSSVAATDERNKFIGNDMSELCLLLIRVVVGGGGFFYYSPPATSLKTSRCTTPSMPRPSQQGVVRSVTTRCDWGPSTRRIVGPLSGVKLANFQVLRRAKRGAFLMKHEGTKPSEPNEYELSGVGLVVARMLVFLKAHSLRSLTWTRSPRSNGV